jgi:type VI secretion system secreted protein VgrG
MESANTSFQSAVDGLIGGTAASLSCALGALFDSITRLYRLDADGELADTHVEAFVLEEALSQPWRMELCVLHERADLDLDAMLSQQVTLVTVLADGTEQRRTGMVLQAHAEDSDGGLARYRLIVAPWIGFLAQSVRSFPWKERNVTDIVDGTLEPYANYGSWRWSPCVQQLLAGASQGGVRSMCTQYRESDLTLISRVLAEEGIGYRFEEADAGSPGPTVVFFADTTTSDSIPEDVSSASAAGGSGIRFHRDGVQEEQDTIQAFGGVRGQPVAVVSAVSYDYKTGRVIGAEVPTIGSVGGANAPWLEAYDTTQGYAYADAGQAERALRLKQQTIEARHKRWIGRGVVRSFTAGTTFTLAESMLDMLDALNPTQDKRFLLTRVTHVGVNNLPKELNASLIRKDVEGGVGLLPRWIPLELREQFRGHSRERALAADAGRRLRQPAACSAARRRAAARHRLRPGRQHAAPGLARGPYRPHGSSSAALRVLRRRTGRRPGHDVGACAAAAGRRRHRHVVHPAHRPRGARRLLR